MPAYRYNRVTGVIRFARRNVGSVRTDPTNPDRMIGRIGQHVATASSAVDAFRAVAALALGYPNVATLRHHNALVRRNNRNRRAAVRSAWAAQPPRRAQTDAELIAEIQRGAMECGETPLTVEQIMATWIRRA